MRETCPARLAYPAVENLSCSSSVAFWSSRLRPVPSVSPRAFSDITSFENCWSYWARPSRMVSMGLRSVTLFAIPDNLPKASETTSRWMFKDSAMTGSFCRRNRFSSPRAPAMPVSTAATRAAIFSAPANSSTAAVIRWSIIEKSAAKAAMASSPVRKNNRVRAARRRVPRNVWSEGSPARRSRNSCSRLLSLLIPSPGNQANRLILPFPGVMTGFFGFWLFRPMAARP